MILTVALLKHLKACESGIDFVVRNNLEGFPLERLNEVEGEYSNYVVWLQDKLSRHDGNDIIGYVNHVPRAKKKNTKTSTFKYDSHGNITYFSYSVEDEDGKVHTYIEERVYTYNGSVLKKIEEKDSGVLLLSIPDF